MSDQTNFRKVFEFNATFGHAAHTEVQHDVFTRDPKLVRLRLDLIREEFNELCDAAKEHDMVEVADALADILVVTYGAGAAFGLDLDKAMSLVHDSNMSKICTTKEEAEKTVEWYEQQFAVGLQPYDTPAYRSSPSGDRWVVFNRSTGKILKNINYRPVDLKDFVGEPCCGC